MSCRSVLLTGVALLLAAPVCAAAPVPSTATAPAPVPKVVGPASLQPGDVIEFSADAMSYSDDDQIVTATGNVVIDRDGNHLTADNVVYNRKSGQVEAIGNVITVDPEGNQAFGDRVQLTESLKDGAIDNILLVLNDGGRLAATSAVRVNGVSKLDRAVYSPCSVTGTDGCPRTPLWQIKALKVIHDPVKHRISYQHASLDFLGLPVVYLPRFSHPDGSAGRASGLLLPEIQYRKALGAGVGIPYNITFGTDRDVTIKPYLYTSVNPVLSLQARQLFKAGPIQLDAYMTYANQTDYAADNVTEINRGDKFRGYFAAKGQLQHDANWRSTFSVRLTTDDTFNRRYDLDYDDLLRSSYALERFGNDQYLSISAWGFQDLRANRLPGQSPFVLPLIDYRYDPEQQILGGHIGVAANTIYLYRTDGQREARGVASARWDRSFLTSFGQRVTATAMVRGDIYDSSNTSLATVPAYAGSGKVEGRFIPVGSIDVEWPFAGPLLGGDQTISPRFQIVASGSGHNSGIPNEDSRAVDLEDTNIFDLNRFPGYDRWEGGTRLTYGFDYKFNRPRFEFTTQLAQSVRLDDRIDSGDLFPGGTGLSGRYSDVVGRTTLKYGSFVSFTARYRIDKSSLSLRRNEIDLALGSSQTYLSIGYLLLNRNINTEDLQDRQEVRLGGRVAFAKYWSIFGSTIIDLTTAKEQPTSDADGFAPVRHRVGVQYEDECFRFGVTWRRDYTQDRDFRRGNSYSLSLAFKNLGF